MIALYLAQINSHHSISSLSQPLQFIFITFLVFFLVRKLVISNFLKKTSPAKKTYQLFLIDLLLFTIMAIISLLYFFYISNILSGLYLLPAFFVMGLFTATHQYLQLERNIILYCSQSSSNISLEKKYISVPTKLTVISVICIISVTFFMSIIVNYDIQWLINLEKNHLYTSQHQLVILKMVIVAAIFLILIINLIYSYAKNLKLLLHNQNSTLQALHSGNLNVHVPLCTNDEFGAMALLTNQMIAKLRTYTNRLRTSHKVTILCLASLAETRDNETGAHIMRTKYYVLILATALKKNPKYSRYLTKEKIKLLCDCSQLHDIGKGGIPDSILLKPGKLTPEEFNIMKRHTVIGYHALQKAQQRLSLQSTPFLKLAQEIIYTHHEKWDGTGYPRVHPAVAGGYLTMDNNGLLSQFSR